MKELTLKVRMDDETFAEFNELALHALLTPHQLASAIVKGYIEGDRDNPMEEKSAFHLRDAAALYPEENRTLAPIRDAMGKARDGLEVWMKKRCSEEGRARFLEIEERIRILPVEVTA